MTRPPKVAFTLTSAMLLAALLFAILHPNLVRALTTSRLSPRVSQFESRLATSDSGAPPAVIFWAWERPEDFRFLQPEQAGVAFLAETVYLRTQRSASSTDPVASFVVRPRLQSLRVTPGSQLIAVVRIETVPAQRPEPSSLFGTNSPPTVSYSAVLRDSLASEISNLQSIPGVSAIQIDFDAKSSQHAFYDALLQDVRHKLPLSMPLSITALASWCIGDPWLAQLPPGTIDEAVPMLFRMGPASSDVIKFLHSGHDFPVASCRASLGLSTDERISSDILAGRFVGLSTAFRRRRIYVFSRYSHTSSAAQSILKEWHP